jgi:hypothetical protein
MKRSVLLVAAALVALAPVAAQARIESNYGINIQSCVVNSNGNGVTNGINVVYSNSHASPAVSVLFLVRYRGARYILHDSGTFTQGAVINHNLADQLVGMGWEGANPNLCTVYRVRLENGRVLGTQ